MRGLRHVQNELASAPVHVFRSVSKLLWIAVIALAVASCGGDGSEVEASLAATPHRVGACSGSFVSHDLPHLTQGPGNTASTFDGTGAGIAAGDLDGDGDIDLVLPNLFGTTTIAENRIAESETQLAFTAHELISGRFRAAATIDIDADDDLDIVLTTGIGPPVLFRNLGSGSLSTRFEREQICGVRAATYAMAWSDLGGDGDLDLVTGSYNAELTILRNSPILGSDTGVVLHEGTPDGFTTTRLSPDAQALAMAIADLNNDGKLDILVGNDLATPDMVFESSDSGWEPVTPFTTTSYSTMSYDTADIDGDGQVELFSTDMAPMADANLDDYREVFEDMEAAPRPDDIQTPENVFLTRDGDSWTNQGRDLGVEATGWSWSGLFGDLDNDGLQDLYVVNGMRSDQLFDFLPDARLVEANQAFRNVDGVMEPVAEWGLNDLAGGRGAVVTDLDGDGDLDIAVNNLDEPARLFENQLCTGSGLTVELRWLGSDNNFALGATVTIEDDGDVQNRLVTSSRGYLSGAAPVVHFGVGDTEDSDLRVRWPDGTYSDLGEVDSNQHLIITRIPNQSN